MAVQHETELYKPLKLFFEAQGYEVKSEVRHCDLVGFRPGEEFPLIVEMKKTFNLALLLQGMQRQKLSKEVYLAVEKNRQKKGAHNQRWGEITQLCRRLGLGLITVTHYKTKKPFVEVLCTPEGTAVYGQKPMKARLNRLANEFRERSGDYNVGGSRGQKLVTAYREKALRVAEVMARSSGPMAPREIRDQSGVGRAADILQRNYYGWFVRIARGRYSLTPEGAAALRTYEQVTNSHRMFAAAGEPSEETIKEEAAVAAAGLVDLMERM
ncbi:DUF2161 family putative PD-(D/E)XK-type phosphodiesterase [Paenibacillus tuaregi]|uniref:DUF2161 family putative PD-(D/E)XK-type phosphodiesterase n=1 Tax=Paenibacillus tuaregi TaxID=1816681 RepID=UPI0008387D6A|nr:DUF2161 family putative PD-(D/E)XK-type phosphodiesterase [Paenibacillus tuaregi]